MEKTRTLEPAMRPRKYAVANDLSLSTVYRQIADGRIKVIRLGRSIRITESEAARQRGETA